MNKENPMCHSNRPTITMGNMPIRSRCERGGSAHRRLHSPSPHPGRQSSAVFRTSLMTGASKLRGFCTRANRADHIGERSMCNSFHPSFSAVSNQPLLTSSEMLSPDETLSTHGEKPCTVAAAQNSAVRRLQALSRDAPLIKAC